ncbi:hypothetical protein [Pontibaca methylaminivorans]|uniref:Uncharacterized protein n=1 Tax=Pontibaca methylaminivorans TaxID=515897 RepID=A0A1R3WYA0_9RHOB|nr:hypothetical protein [Pontibaca methylaminivorans]SIT81905.1 hypothetical protein SAMN05421849_1575 [Pontibaca methylaminivorans]
MAIQANNTGALPVARLHEIHDCLSLVLDATERPTRYSQAEREARSYTRAALRHVERMIGGAA